MNIRAIAFVGSLEHPRWTEESINKYCRTQYRMFTEVEKQSAYAYAMTAYHLLFTVTMKNNRRFIFHFRLFISHGRQYFQRF